MIYTLPLWGTTHGSPPHVRRRQEAMMSHADTPAPEAASAAGSAEFTAAEEKDARALRARLGLEAAEVPTMEELLAMPALLRAMHAPVQEPAEQSRHKVDVDRCEEL